MKSRFHPIGMTMPGLPKPILRTAVSQPQIAFTVLGRLHHRESQMTVFSRDAALDFDG